MTDKEPSKNESERERYYYSPESTELPGIKMTIADTVAGQTLRAVDFQVSDYEIRNCIEVMRFLMAEYKKLNESIPKQKEYRGPEIG